MYHSLNASVALSATMRAMAREDVAAGEGALRTWSMRPPNAPVPLSNTKSSTSWPSEFRACARTPAGPLQLHTYNYIEEIDTIDILLEYLVIV